MVSLVSISIFNSTANANGWDDAGAIHEDVNKSYKIEVKFNSVLFLKRIRLNSLYTSDLAPTVRKRTNPKVIAKVHRFM